MAEEGGIMMLNMGMITTICCASTIDQSWLSDADRKRVRMKLPTTKPFAPVPAVTDAAANWA